MEKVEEPGFLSLTRLNLHCKSGDVIVVEKHEKIDLVRFNENCLGIRISNDKKKEAVVLPEDENSLISVKFQNYESMSTARQKLIESGFNVFMNSISEKNEFMVRKKDLDTILSKLKMENIEAKAEFQTHRIVPKFFVYEINSNTVANGLMKNVIHESQIHSGVVFRTYRIKDLISENVDLHALARYLAKYKKKAFVERDKVRIPVRVIKHLTFDKKSELLPVVEVQPYQIKDVVIGMKANESCSYDYMVTESCLEADPVDLFKKYVKTISGVELVGDNKILLSNVSKQIMESTYMCEPIFDKLKIKWVSDKIFEFDYKEDEKGEVDPFFPDEEKEEEDLSLGDVGEESPEEEKKEERMKRRRGLFREFDDDMDLRLDQEDEVLDLDDEDEDVEDVEDVDLDVLDVDDDDDLSSELDTDLDVDSDMDDDDSADDEELVRLGELRHNKRDYDFERRFRFSKRRKKLREFLEGDDADLSLDDEDDDVLDLSSDDDLDVPVDVPRDDLDLDDEEDELSEARKRRRARRRKLRERLFESKRRDEERENLREFIRNVRISRISK